MKQTNTNESGYIIGEIFLYIGLLVISIMVATCYFGIQLKMAFLIFTPLFILLPSLFLLVYKSLPLQYYRNLKEIKGLVTFDESNPWYKEIDIDRGYILYEKTKNAKNDEKGDLIYIDEDCKTFYFCTDNYDFKTNPKLSKNIGKLEYKARRMPDKKSRFYYFQTISQAYIMNKKEDYKSTEAIAFIGKALEYIKEEEINHIRTNEILGATFFVIIYFLIRFSSIDYLFEFCGCFLDEDSETILNIVLFSMLGGLVSVFFNPIPKKFRILKSLKRFDNIFNGFIRLATGVIGGFIIYIFSVGNFILGAVDKSNKFAMFSVYVLAGYSLNFIIDQLNNRKKDMDDKKGGDNSNSGNSKETKE